jgi:AMP deaminase
MRHCCRSSLCELPFISFLLIFSSNGSRIDKYTSLANPATPTTATSVKTEQNTYPLLTAPASPTSSTKTIASSSSVAADSMPSYQQFPAQAARIPINHSQTKLDSHTQQPTQENGSPLQPTTSIDHARKSSVVMSPKLAELAKETSWPVEGYGDLHLSGSEPRIFPGVVSRTQRRDSKAGQAVRQGSQSETDGDGSVGKGRARGNTTLDGSVDEKTGESDGEMEEAGGVDE